MKTRFSTFHVENEWKILKQKFKCKVKNNKKTGREKATCKYEK